ncbi:DUF481 domain-containing protein [Parendozoicomonas haliclonae]|uniref:DUF481 domain-containing protein n=1 Tax=Parendozoicomonas haliclonae TaxID=1960125 RepID=UPI0013FDA5CB|nr:DUF481 domain-containing protein [Parendozoicomonas haliclonae]
MSFVTCLVISLPGLADTLLLNNGNVLSGKILELKDGKVRFDTEWAGEINIDIRFVESVETESLLWVRMKGQDNFRLVRLYREGEHTWLADESGNSTRLDSQENLASLQAVEPDDDRWVHSGSVNLGLALNDGEHKEREVNTSGSVNVRDRVHRNIFAWKGKYAKEDDVLDDKRLRLNYDYNRFLDRHWYTLANGMWLYDLDESPYRRYSLGGGLGYEFWDRSTGSLKTDTGLNYLWEDYKTGGNVKHWALRWSVSGMQHLSGDLYSTLGSVVFYRLGDADQLLWDLDLGLKYRISSRLWFNLLYSLDYDSKPSSDGVRTATSLTFGLGYGW